MPAALPISVCTPTCSLLAIQARSPLVQLLQLGLRLLQPELHVHLAVHRHRGSEVLVSLLTLPDTPVERAEAKVAVGDERAHAEVGGECHGLTVRVPGLLGLGGL